MINQSSFIYTSALILIYRYFPADFQQTTTVNSPGGLGPQALNSLMFYDPMIQFLWNYVLLLYEKWLLDQVIILHMPWQLSCHGMCKSVT